MYIRMYIDVCIPLSRTLRFFLPFMILFSLFFPFHVQQYFILCCFWPTYYTITGYCGRPIVFPKKQYCASQKIFSNHTVSCMICSGTTVMLLFFYFPSTVLHTICTQYHLISLSFACPLYSHWFVVPLLSIFIPVRYLVEIFILSIFKTHAPH